MSNLPLSEKSHTELRGLALALGLPMKWKHTKAELIKMIQEDTRRAVAPKPLVSDTPEDQRLRTAPPARNLPQTKVFEALEPLRSQGLVVTFPTPETIQFTYQAKGGLREDSINIRSRLWVILDAAKRVLNG